VKQRLYDYVSRHQNVATIPAEHIRRIGSFGRAVDDLTDKFGREPTTHELADHLGVAPKKITALRKAYRPVTLESSDDSFESAVDDASRERVLLAYYGLTDQEKLVFDYSLGAHGQPKLSTKEIATKLRVTDARVSNLKATLATKLAPYLDT
jgi:DNA-directed RNA polymerase specialized sigma subunit